MTLGEVYKDIRRWGLLRIANIAVTRLDPAHRIAWWNMGIAATAQRRWEAAHRAWTALGCRVPTDPGAPEGALICVHPDHGEWVQLLNPALAQILTVPTPDSGHRYGDVVLLDYIVLGAEMYGGQTLPVRNTLGLVGASRFETWYAWITLDADDDGDGWRTAAEGPGVVTQNWMPILGRLTPPAPGLVEPWREQPVEGALLIGIAALDIDCLLKAIKGWLEARPGRNIEQWGLGVGRLGQESGVLSLSA
ncbi:hypothetical protein GCM10008955_36490 [Deinococcus malanensis]|uniref:DUF3750 domain-containing protein n=1 Tax=Deinococcus malanensis TaxID=1706855 RepID=A0ABQ2F4L0_9DEIO|nr:hypothetical protein [Deinococcus malanensis]GGK39382.1 hypothetical protein GCM10008955_36490 [Deinococcus malanensis]